MGSRRALAFITVAALAFAGCGGDDGGGGDSTETPSTETPSTDAPSTDAPATDAPATDAPATDAPNATGSYNNGVIDVPAIQSPVVTVDQGNLVAALIDSGYYSADDFTGLDALGSGEAEEAPAAGEVSGKVGIVLPTRDEPRWVQDETRFREALEAAGYEVEILFSQGDSARERTNVEDLITQGVQVLIITPHDGTAAAAAAEAARDAGVSVIS